MYHKDKCSSTIFNYQNDPEEYLQCKEEEISADEPEVSIKSEDLLE
jgi:hypothetical protein